MLWTSDRFYSPAIGKIAKSISQEEPAQGALGYFRENWDGGFLLPLCSAGLSHKEGKMGRKGEVSGKSSGRNAVS